MSKQLYQMLQISVKSRRLPSIPLMIYGRIVVKKPIVVYGSSYII